MFTGIIREVGIIKSKTSSLLAIESKHFRPKLGQSLSIDGACLTVMKKIGNNLLFEVIPETLSRTRFKYIKEGDSVNLESSLRIGDSMDGHIVTGHIDTTVKILSANSDSLALDRPKKLSRFIVEKGSVALNGVSLTVASVKPKTFSVALTTYTKKHTNLGQLKQGDRVNLEVDLLARYTITNESRHRRLNIL